ncbi:MULTISPECIES: alpha/beta hydrolase family esterase [Bacillaceae]|uniref:Phospholipase/carboxylesterase/thioesterase domain-containing protein n=1 Tax=Evansella alkalicola TaxID=745819 RepID=A0ABS6JV51_9BACI|nr:MULTISPECIES: hypothetical protein [Bacillaceae]MBU9722137.1 hypothetical protein [Bacillus alkalicola]
MREKKMRRKGKLSFIVTAAVMLVMLLGVGAWGVAAEEEITDNDMSAEEASGSSGYDMVQEAKALGITPGKYNIITNLLGEEVTEENIGLSVQELMSRFAQPGPPYRVSQTSSELEVEAVDGSLFNALVEVLDIKRRNETIDGSAVTHFTYISDNENVVESVINGDHATVDGSLHLNGSANLEVLTVTIDGRVESVDLQFNVQKTGAMVLSDGFSHAEYDRNFQYYIPSSYDGQSDVPLLFYFHGMGGSGNVQGAWRDIAEEEGVIAVFPSSTVLPLDDPNSGYLPGFFGNPLPVAGTQWDPGYSIALQYIYRDQVDDVGFVSAMIDHFDELYTIDLDRVYATGFSSGGMFSFNLAVNLSDRLAAVAPLGATMTLGYELNDESPTTPISIIHVMGEADTVIPFQGGTDNFGANFGEPAFHHFLDVGPWWADKLGIDNDGRVDGETVNANVTRYSYSGDHADIIQYAIAGHGHSEPNNVDINRQIVWDYLSQYTLNTDQLQ